jgi:F-type H+-transporting ATPase subunit delta
VSEREATSYDQERSERWIRSGLSAIVLKKNRSAMQTMRWWREQFAQMVKGLRRLARSKRVQRLAKIETAVALSGNLKARLQDDLVRIYGPALRISFVQSPALIGGMRITVGSDLYDGSVKGTLAALEGAFRD